jgi:alpha/beta superfamily hydrolase
MNDTIIHFVHGKESGSWGSKILHLAMIAKELGFSYDSLDYSGLNKEQRVSKLLDNLPKDKKIILVGSSMGGWVATRVSEIVNITGLFLMAPAINFMDYSALKPNVNNDNLFIVHGWHDTIIPLEGSINFSKDLKCSLLIVDDDHRLNDKINIIGENFRNFLLKISTQYL